MSRKIEVADYRKTLMITGVNGAGKTTLVRGLAEIDPNVVCFSASTNLMRILGLKPDDYEGLRQMGNQEKDRAFSAMMRKVGEGRNHDAANLLIIDTHVIHCRNGRMVQCDTEWMSGVIDAIGLVTTDMDALMKQIVGDNTKIRDMLPVGTSPKDMETFLAQVLEQTKLRAEELAVELEVPFFEIINRYDSTGGIQGSVGQLQKIKAGLLNNL